MSSASSLAEWMADIGKAADELGYGILRLEMGSIVLVARQSNAEVSIDSPLLSGDFLRSVLVPIPHRSGSGYTPQYMATVPR